MPSELAAALAKVQAELPHIAKGEKANVGQYSYEYADLTAVSQAILPLLGKHGLAFTAWPTLDDGKFVLSYTLLHSSGEERTGTYPLPDKGTPQQLGGHITYARRYALCAVTGVAPGGEDNDAAGATEVNMDRQVKTAWTDPEHVRLTQPEPEERVNGRQAERRRSPDPDDPWATAAPEDQPGSATPEQVRDVQMAYQKLGFKRAERQHMLLASAQLIKRELTGPNEGLTHNNLSYNEAADLKAKLAKTTRADLVAQFAEAAS
jgi:hypothetical protein